MKILIIEDEAAFLHVILGEMEKAEIEAVGARKGEEGLEYLKDHDFDMVVTDLRLPDMDGIEIIRQTRESGDETPFLLMTAYASVKTAVSALQSGAADYLIKPLRVPDLIRRVQQIYDLDNLRRENTLLKRIVNRDTSKFWYSDNLANKKIEKIVAKVSATDLTVLINGESGTGKGVTARNIHAASNRNGGQFVAVNCGAIPENLVESELFGHVKGAFTGAEKSQDGLFVAAINGTLFLDEIGELPQASQVKLLHAIEEKTIRPVGSTKLTPVDVRILAATNKDLEQEVEAGNFRRDLFFRLNVVQISLPSLVDQRDSLASATQFFIDKYSEQYGLKDLTVDPEVWNVFNNYNWPGNFRELDNAVERMLLLCSDSTITLEDVPPHIMGESGEGQSYISGTFKDLVQAYEKQIIMQAIQAAEGDRRTAADNLQIGLSTLYRKLEEGEPG